MIKQNLKKKLFSKQQASQATGIKNVITIPVYDSISSSTPSFYPQENEEKLSLLFIDVTNLPNLLLVLV